MSHPEFWRGCVGWLVSIGALPRNHKTCHGDAEIFDLAQTLRDGVVLCNTLNLIYPGIVDESRINHRAHMSEFLCMQNIRVVIYTLQTYFRMAANELFTAEDLYQMKNFAQVLRTLSILSCTPEIAKHVRPFEEQRRSSQHRNSVDEEDVYGNLADLATERSLADEEGDLYDSVSEDKEEGIYGSLIATKPTPAKLDKRGYCFQEIVETEGNYVSHLQMIIEEYMNPLRNLVGEPALRKIFINTEALYPIHKNFNGDLVKLKQSVPTARVGEVFLRHQDEFVIYGEYCSRLIEAQDHLRAVSENATVRAKIETCQEQSRRSKFKLRDLLTVPMQRLLKYHLLVRELLKHTPDTHADKQDLEKALEGAQALAQYINEVKRDSEELVKITQVEQSLGDYDKGIPLRTYGRVRFDGELKVRYGDEKANSRNVFLFDQALFMTKLKGDSYYLKDLVRLEDMQLDEMPTQRPSKPKWSHCWKLVSVKFGPSYTLNCKTDSDKQKWIDAFKESFDNISPRVLKGESHNFAMHTFSEPTRCQCCSRLLRGTFYQGYRCSVSGVHCHKECLAEGLKLSRSGRVNEVPPVSRRESVAPPIPGPRPGQGSIIHNKVPDPSKNLNYKAHREYNGNPPPPFPNANIITFQIGQPIEVTNQVSPDWWQGRSLADYEKIGFFPASHVSPQRIGRPERDDPTNRPKPCLSSHEQLKNYYWYAGEIVRGEAEKTLKDRPTGTFLVRNKPPLNLVLSLTYQSDVKHIKILQTDDSLFYVAECKHFRSVQELIRFYEKNSLSGFFLGLETTLKYAYRNPEMFPDRNGIRTVYPLPAPYNVRVTSRFADGLCDKIQVLVAPLCSVSFDGKVFPVIGKAIAKYDFDARSEQELSLVAGQFVNIISKAGGDHGWWKGEYDRKIGYFPISFVDEQY